MACPDVHPSAYRVPKPIRKPPIARNRSPLRLKILSQAKSSSGTKSAPGFEIPKEIKLSIVLGLRSTVVSGVIRLPAMKPPMIVPKTKKSPHLLPLRSTLKKSETRPAPHMVQRVLKFEDIPNLLPKMRSRNILSVIRGPATYQGQG